MTSKCANASAKMNYERSCPMKPHSKTPMPAAKLRTLDDGCIRIQIGDGPGAFVGVVSSHHLVPPKVNQLQQYWVKAQAANANQSFD